MTFFINQLSSSIDFLGQSINFLHQSTFFVNLLSSSINFLQQRIFFIIIFLHQLATISALLLFNIWNFHSKIDFNNLKYYCSRIVEECATIWLNKVRKKSIQSDGDSSYGEWTLKSSNPNSLVSLAEHFQNKRHSILEDSFNITECNNNNRSQSPWWWWRWSVQDDERKKEQMICRLFYYLKCNSTSINLKCFSIQR